MAKFVTVQGSRKKINIEDESWKDIVVNIGRKYYFRDDDSVVQVDVNYGSENIERKLRYFRKVSPLLVVLYNKKHCIKKNAVKIHNGSWVPKSYVKSHKVVTTVDKELHWKQHCNGIGGVYYHELDDRVYVDALSGGWMLKEGSVPLGYDEENIVDDLYRMNIDGTTIYPLRTKQTSEILECAYDKRMYAKVHMVNVGVKEERFVFKNNLQFLPDLHYQYQSLRNGDFKFKPKEDMEILEGLYLPISSSSKENIEKNLTVNYADEYKKFAEFIEEYYPVVTGMKQNEPKYFKSPPEEHMGGEVMMTANPPLPPRKSSMTNKTGRIGYTYGVEFEVSAGDVPNAIIENLYLDRMSDGSLRHRDGNHTAYGVYKFQGYEYVTKPMHGNLGIENIEKVADVLKQFTLLSKQCSTHIHVGGKSYGAKSSEKPMFNREFGARALKLASLVEDDLFELLPKERKESRHCTSVKNWGRINAPFPSKKEKRFFAKKNNKGSEGETRESRHKNYENNLVDFVFRSGDSKFNSEQNNKSRLGRWTQSRYVWLNLINCNTDNSSRRASSFQTIEFRAFPATHEFKHLYFYVLFSLAFVWFVENRPQDIIKGKVTLRRMMLEAIKSEEVGSFVKNYIRNTKRQKKLTSNTER